MEICYSRNIAWQDYFDTIYIFNEHTRNTYVLKDSARCFWLLISKNRQFDKICSMLRKDYTDISFDILKQDFYEFAVSLENEDLLYIIGD